MSGNLIRCQNGHLFSSRRYGTVCPYCNIETATKEKKSVEKSQEEIEDILFLEEENPVCGWIVCVKGPRRGKDYGSWTERILWDGQMIWTFRFWGITKSHGEIMR